MDQSMKLQTDAEKEADAAMNQLEEYITEQEKLEEAEENQVHQIAGLLSPKDNLSSAGHSPVPTHPVQQQTASPEPEQELLRLMQQTDDAKVQEMNARLGTCVSAPPAVDTEPIKILRREVSSELPSHSCIPYFLRSISLIYNVMSNFAFIVINKTSGLMKKV
uniref:Uncharacterized protein n=1 Tax=Biomphalaria glabrata TaxID=6526 RepID=A0A2C9KSX2_BIOGL